MDRVNVYTYTTVRGPRTKSGTSAYVLEYPTQKGPVTLSKIERVDQVTENAAHLKVVLAAMDRLTRGCEVKIFTDSQYVKSGAERWIQGWEATGWVTARSRPVANADEWKKFAELLGRHLISVEVGVHHPYRDWMQRETDQMEKERRICMKDSGNLTVQQRSTKRQ